jgi:glycosyltransferase involved in cell wall biosynthesis
VTGKLAEPFDTDALAEAMFFIVSDRERQTTMGEQARTRAQTLWAPEVIAAQYLDVLDEAMGRAKP